MIADTLSQPGLGWLAVAACIAAAVRGFSGFGAAMVYLPVASRFLTPIEALATMAIIDFFAPMPLLASAWRKADKRDLALLGLGLVLLMPVGLAALRRLSPDGYGWIVSIAVLCVVAVLMTGWRYRGQIRTWTLLVIGSLAGFAGGFIGLPGPLVVVTYMASTRPVAVIRANLMLFLYLYDIALIALLLIAGNLTAGLMILGLILAVPAIAGSLIGAFFFNPDHEKTYRRAAYGIIMVAALSALPIFH